MLRQAGVSLTAVSDQRTPLDRARLEALTTYSLRILKTSIKNMSQRNQTACIIKIGE